MATSKNPAEQNLKAAGNPDLALSDSELKEARKEGAKEDAKQTAQDAHHALTDGSLPGAPPAKQYHGWDEIQPYAPFLELGADEFEDRVSKKPKGDIEPLADEKVYGLLALERNGQNRTPYVKAMMKRLDLKKEELPGGGPGYTNDVTNLSDL